MKNTDDLKSLIQAVVHDEISLETAIELHIDDPSIDVNNVCAALCYYSLGQLDQMVNIQTMRSVSETVDRLSLVPFVRLVSEADSDCQFPIGSSVDFYGETCRVIGCRRSTKLAMPQHDKFDLFLESSNGIPLYFVGESLLKAIGDA